MLDVLPVQWRVICEEGLKAAKIHSDDMPLSMLIRGKDKTAQGRLWTYVVDNRVSGSAAPALVWYRLRQTAAVSIRRPA